jgi:uncharacterized membrane protein YbhN (UPF0104 family)
MLTAIKWIVMTAMYLLAFRVFGARISPASAATIPVIASLVGYVPITIGGAGTMEWTAVTLFGGLGVDQSTVVVAYLFLRAVLIGWALLLMLVVRELPR